MTLAIFIMTFMFLIMLMLLLLLLKLQKLIKENLSTILRIKLLYSS